MSADTWHHPKIIYAATLRSGNRIIFGVFDDARVWLRLISRSADISYIFDPEAWRAIRSLPEHGLGHFFALAG